MSQKYEMTDETKVVHGRRLYRIKALRDFGSVKAGELGGWIQREENLSHDGTAWIRDNACVMDSAVVRQAAQVSGIASITDYAIVTQCASISDSATIRSRAFVGGNAKIEGGVDVSGGATIYGDAHIFGNARVSDETKVGGKIRIFEDAIVGGTTRAESGELHGQATLIGEARLIGCQSIEIYKPSHCLIISVGGFSNPIYRMTFAHIKDGNIYMSCVSASDIYEGAIEEWLSIPFFNRSLERNIILSTIEFAKNHIADTIYTA